MYVTTEKDDTEINWNVFKLIDDDYDSFDFIEGR